MEKPEGSSQSEDESSEEPEHEENEELKKHTKELISDTGIHLGPATINAMGVEIHEWLPVEDNIPEHPSLAFFGKRRTGKSTTIMNLCYHCFQHIPFVMVMSNTAFAGYWEQYIPKQFIFQGMRGDILDELVARQKRLIKQFGKENPVTFAMIIMDDIIADQKAIRWTPSLQSFFVEGRHLNITILIATQNVKGVGPMIRRNLDYAFVQPMRALPEIDALYELFGSMHIENKKEWKHFLKEVVHVEVLPGSTAAKPKKSVRPMVVANFEDAEDATGQFFWWVPVYTGDLPAFRLAHRVYWDQPAPPTMSQSNPSKNRPDPVSVLDELDYGLNQ